ncbi:DUF2058 domain-containing protein [Wenzhouxiangella marina]|uniref:Uncharacterized protein n=1 Tax=Wenzhouxiangella marina TaxID=1579979 RepID=A0A0K0XXG0_9GAMM|nr:DUF2058 family protein [Wenzhouxiangella marina]AKS42317.1 hypothetical protein WM2015_1951 [Wenzhouxiangella marina]MBB6085910.1 uncharacterized protein YaiL (DUF2058 family) [Wenzhouxiangella marina]
MGSLQDALLKAGLADESQARTQRRDRPGAARSGPGNAKGRPAKQSRGRKSSGKSGGASDLERAYKAREQAEKREKEDRKKARVAAQEARRKRNEQLDELVRGKTLNRKDAEEPRYFEHLGRIRRVLCTPEQRAQLNAGEIGVVNLRGSYLLIDLDTLSAYREIAEDLVPDLSPKEPEDDGSHYPPVPDDLIW